MPHIFKRAEDRSAEVCCGL